MYMNEVMLSLITQTCRRGGGGGDVGGGSVMWWCSKVEQWVEGGGVLQVGEVDRRRRRLWRQDVVDLCHL